MQVERQAAAQPIAKPAGAFRLLPSLSVMRVVISFAVAALLWELAARLLVGNPLFFSPLTAVLRRGFELYENGELQVHVATSFIEFGIGFAMATVVGILCGIVMAAFPALRGFFDPWVSMLYATPIIALGPLFILWFGIGLGSKVAIIFLTAVFPILINTLTGLTNTDRTLVEVARSFGANPRQLYGKVRLPSAIPYIIAGLRLGVARALVGVVVAELFGARAGLGFLILMSAQSFDTPALFVGVLILAVVGVVSVEFLKWLEFRLAPWRATDEDA